METTTCCAYNATRGHTLSVKVTLADSARQPLKVLKVLLRGLALDAQSGLWLTPLLSAPQMMRLLPFDLVYLDSELKVLQGVELYPEVPFPPFDRQVASALILPLYSLESTGTELGDQLLVCSAEELELHLAAISHPTAIAPQSTAPSSASSAPLASSPGFSLPPVASALVSFPMRAGAVSQGTGFTLAMSTSWQITNSTMAALPEVAEVAAPTAQIATSPVDAAAEAAVKPTEVAEVAGASHVQELSISEALVESPSSSVLEDVEEGLPPTEEITAHVAPDFVAVSDPTTPDETREADFTVAPGADGSAAAAEIEAVPTQTDAQASAEVQPSITELDVASAVVVDIGSDTAEKRASTNIETEASSEKSETKKKDSLGTKLKRWLNAEDPLEERRATIRLLSPGLIAYSSTDNDSKPREVGDVSPTGLYLRTDERWQPGDVISLTLEKTNAAERDYGSRVVVKAGAIRQGSDGVGLSFVLPGDVEFRPWNRVHTKRSDETDGAYFVRELRIARALGFLRRICPPAAEEIRQLLYERHSNKRVASAVAIALKAEDLLARNRDAVSALAHPEMVLRIVEDGSWADDDLVQQLWAGLLVSSCTADGQDKSNVVFVDMLQRLTPIHLKIFTAACRKGVDVVTTGESTAKMTLYLTADELIEAAGSNSLARIQQTIGHLSNFGLLAESTRPSYVAATEKTKTKTTPTILGLQMYERCNGHR
jgi:hypothetical protein